MSYGAFDLTGKVAVITGGNGGIGLGMADAIASSGASVCIWGTNEEKNENALKQLEAHGGKCLALRCDVSNEEAVGQAFSKVVDTFGRVDACFANAGVSGRFAGKSFADMPTEEWRRVMSVNLDGAFFTLRAAVGHMISREGGGSLVLTSSLSALEGAAYVEHYAATKGALLSMMRSLAVELARYKVRANAIVPGWIDTAMTEGVFATPAFQKKVLPRVPMRRWGKPADFGGIAVYLMSDASVFHSGDTFIIDGGYTVF
jgi:NAD(P)-dependent dehydrogenase (short-subunit alcohol dehydrogenase family)